MKRTAKKQRGTGSRSRSLVRRNIFWIILFVILIAAAVVVCLKLFKPFGEKEEEKKEPEISQVEEKKEDKKEEKDETADDGQTKLTPVQYDGADPNTLSELTGVITSNSVVDGVYRVRVNIDQYITSGTCTITISNASGSVYSGTVATDTAASTSTCQGFDVATSMIGSGNFSVVIDITGDGKAGRMETEINI